MPKMPSRGENMPKMLPRWKNVPNMLSRGQNVPKILPRGKKCQTCSPGGRMCQRCSRVRSSSALCTLDVLEICFKGLKNQFGLRIIRDLFLNSLIHQHFPKFE